MTLVKIWKIWRWKCLLCYSIQYQYFENQTGSLIWVLKDMFQFFRFLPKSDYASLWCLLPVVDEDCENVKTMSGFRTCPHFPLNPIIVNFNLCFFYLLSFLCLVKEHVLIFCWIPSLLILIFAFVIIIAIDFQPSSFSLLPLFSSTPQYVFPHFNSKAFKYSWSSSAVSDPPEYCPIFHFPFVRPFFFFSFSPSSSPPSLDSGRSCHPPHPPYPR